MGIDYVIQAVGCDIPNAVWGLRVISAQRCRTGGPGATFGMRCVISAL